MRPIGLSASADTELLTLTENSRVHEATGVGVLKLRLWATDMQIVSAIF